MITSLSIISTWFLGFVFIYTLWPTNRSLKHDWLLIFSLGIGAGLGLTSCIFFFTSLIFTNPRWITLILDLSILIICIYFILRRRRQTTAFNYIILNIENITYLLLLSTFLQMCIVCGISIVRYYNINPWGDWDGWAIWNLHAKFILTGGRSWASLLHQPALEWSHPDYPLLIPLSVARICTLTGELSSLGAQLVAASFTLGTLGLIISTISIYKNKLIALVAGLILVSTPSFIRLTASQCADIPLGYFILATIILLFISNNEKFNFNLQLLLSLFTGFAAWTKNEGLLFTAIICLCWLALKLLDKEKIKTKPFILGLILSLAPLIVFKVFFSAQNDLTSSHFLNRISSLWNTERNKIIINYFGIISLKFGEWSTVPFLLMALGLIGTKWEIIKKHCILPLSITLLMLCGYYIVYLLTPLDLVYHLSTSLNRLLLQLWPSIILIWSLAINFPVKTTLLDFKVAYKSIHPAVFGLSILAINTILGFILIYSLK
jgi:hypothetical protein